MTGLDRILLLGALIMSALAQYNAGEAHRHLHVLLCDLTGKACEFVESHQHREPVTPSAHGNFMAGVKNTGSQGFWRVCVSRPQTTSAPYAGNELTGGHVHQRNNCELHLFPMESVGF